LNEKPMVGLLQTILWTWNYAHLLQYMCFADFDTFYHCSQQYT